jgi:hypothetical protein
LAVRLARSAVPAAQAIMIARMMVEPGMLSVRARMAEPAQPMMAVVCPAAK